MENYNLGKEVEESKTGNISGLTKIIVSAGLGLAMVLGVVGCVPSHGGPYRRDGFHRQYTPTRQYVQPTHRAPQIYRPRYIPQRSHRPTRQFPQRPSGPQRPHGPPRRHR